MPWRCMGGAKLRRHNSGNQYQMKMSGQFYTPDTLHYSGWWWWESCRCRELDYTIQSYSLKHCKLTDMVRASIDTKTTSFLVLLHKPGITSADTALHPQHLRQACRNLNWAVKQDSEMPKFNLVWWTVIMGTGKELRCRGGGGTLPYLSKFWILPNVLTFI